MEQVLTQYLQLLWKAFQYDIDVFSQGWIYYSLLIPAIFYFVFFLIKWMILTAPVWIPIRLALGTIRSMFKIATNKKQQ